jgi:hypothetical protein
VFPRLFDKKPPHDQVRAWRGGSATG